MEILTTGSKTPETITKSIFLAGPMSRTGATNWHKDACEILKKKGFDGTVFCPSAYEGPYEGQVNWENTHLNMADVILFWVPRTTDMPAFTTNIEWGEWFKSSKVVLGYPPDAFKMRYLDLKARQNGIPVSSTLEQTIDTALALLNSTTAAKRTGGERFVPLFIWNTKSFQAWYSAVKEAGNSLNYAQVLFTYRVGPKKFVFAWILQVSVHITAEGRDKTNEFVFARSDISTVVAFCPGKTIFDTRILLVKEFRSPCSNKSGYVYELPGGSAKDQALDNTAVVAEELAEETGLHLGKSRFTYLQSRQLGATLSAHKAHLYAVRLTKEEMDSIPTDKTFGVAEDTELTYLAVQNVRDLLEEDLIDWSMMGMVFKAMLGVNAKEADWVSEFIF